MNLAHAFRIRIEIGRPLEVGAVAGMRKRVMPITGGVVEGEALQGRILPGGADWQSIGPDGVARIFARYEIETGGGAIVSVIDDGVRHGPPEVMARLGRGEPVDPGLYYFRTAPRFETADPDKAWLMRTLFVARGSRGSDGVAFDVFRVE